MTCYHPHVRLIQTSSLISAIHEVTLYTTKPSLLILASQGGVEPAAKTSWSKNKKLALFVPPSVHSFSLLLVPFLSFHHVVVSFAPANRGQLGQSANEGAL